MEHLRGLGGRTSALPLYASSPVRAKSSVCLNIPLRTLRSACIGGGRPPDRFPSFGSASTFSSISWIFASSSSSTAVSSRPALLSFTAAMDSCWHPSSIKRGSAEASLPGGAPFGSGSPPFHGKLAPCGSAAMRARPSVVITAPSASMRTRVGIPCTPKTLLRRRRRASSMNGTASHGMLL